MPEAPGRRWLSLFAYTMFVGVGVTSLISPLVTFTSTVTLTLTYVWSAVTALGGLLGSYGILKKSPLMEFYGLPLQWTCTILFGVSAFVRGITLGQWGSLVVGMLMFALTAKLLGRWWDIARLIRALERRRDGKQ
jgi:hypothetical protein